MAKDNIVTQDALTTIAKALKDDLDNKLNALSSILDQIIVKATYNYAQNEVIAPRTVLNAVGILLDWGHGNDPSLYVRNDYLYNQYIDEGISLSPEIWRVAPPDTLLAGIYSRTFYRTDDGWGDGSISCIAVFIDDRYDQYYVKTVEI